MPEDAKANRLRKLIRGSIAGDTTSRNVLADLLLNTDAVHTLGEMITENTPQDVLDKMQEALANAEAYQQEIQDLIDDALLRFLADPAFHSRARLVGRALDISQSSPNFPTVLRVLVVNEYIDEKTKEVSL